MRRFLITAAALLLCNSFAGIGQQQKSEPRLSVSLRADRSVKITGHLNLKVVFTNTGNAPFLLQKNPSWGVGRTEIQVFDASPRRVFTGFYADQLWSPPSKLEDFIELKPHEAFSVPANGRATDFVNGTGTYQFRVVYVGVISESWAKKYLHLPKPHPPLWSRDRGPVVSEPIEVTVAP